MVVEPILVELVVVEPILVEPVVVEPILVEPATGGPSNACVRGPSQHECLRHPESGP